MCFNLNKTKYLDAERTVEFVNCGTVSTKTSSLKLGLAEITATFLRQKHLHLGARLGTPSAQCPEQSAPSEWCGRSNQALCSPLQNAKSLCLH